MFKNEQPNLNNYEDSEAKEPTDQAIEVLTYMQYATKRLKNLYGINELGTAEGVALRNIIEELIPRYNEEKILVEQGKMSSMNSFEIEEEAVEHWLREQLQVEESQIPKIYVVKDYTNEKTYEFELNDEESAKAKEEELEAKGYNAFCYLTIPNEAKELLERKREKKNLL
jgi:hypothetical protein